VADGADSPTRAGATPAKRLAQPKKAPSHIATGLYFIYCILLLSTTGKLVYVISRLFYFQNPRYA
jgi:hypothetical protein